MLEAMLSINRERSKPVWRNAQVKRLLKVVADARKEIEHVADQHRDADEEIVKYKRRIKTEKKRLEYMNHRAAIDRLLRLREKIKNEN